MLAARTGPRLDVERIPLADAVGRVLARELRALGQLPSYASSAMDGWAVAGQGPWLIRGQVLAGDTAARVLTPGTAMTIATGGMLPGGSDGVLRSEDGETEPGNNGALLRVRAGAPSPTGRHARPAGQEATLGDLLASSGTVLTPPLVGLVAAAGHDEVDVVRRATVAPLLFGDELTHAGIAAPGEVRDALGPQLRGFLTALGTQPAAPVFVPDDLEATLAAICGTHADVVVTTGSTAHGPRDLLHRALAELGAALVIDMVAMRPGHPMLLAVLPDGRPLVGLPGNPLSASAGLLTLMDPLVRGMAGREVAPVTPEMVADAITGPPDMHRLAPVTRTPDGLRVTDWTGSGMLRGLASADALAVLPPGGAEAGQAVDVLRLPW